MRGVGSELPAAFLPGDVLIYPSSLVAWWEPAGIRSMFFASDCDGKTLDGKLFPLPPLVFAVRDGNLMAWALAEDRRPEPDSWLQLAPYWNVHSDDRVCRGTMPTPMTATIDKLPEWSRAFFASRFTGSNLGTQQCTPRRFHRLRRSLTGKKQFPVEYLIRKGTLREMLCASR